MSYVPRETISHPSPDSLIVYTTVSIANDLQPIWAICNLQRSDLSTHQHQQHTHIIRTYSWYSACLAYGIWLNTI